MEHSDFDSAGEPQVGPGGRDRYTPAVGLLLALPLLFVALVFAGAVWVWFGWRIPVGKGQFVPLLRKTGGDITNEMILVGPEFKGPQFEILKEGRHFKNPYNWWWPGPIDATIIPTGKVGIVVRKYGKPLAEGQVVAEADDEKGILKATLLPGRHYLNTWAYDVKMVDMVKVEPGHMGVVTLLVGETAPDPNVFVVAEGKRGTQPTLLGPGTHPAHSNIFVHKVTPVDTRFQKFEMADKDAVFFLSVDGFDITVEGTIEWAPDKQSLPELFVKYVDLQDIDESGGINSVAYKYVLQIARSLIRLEGGRHKAVEYMTGDTRIAVQDEVEKRLRESCQQEGIIIRSFVIRAAEPPTRIREQYERREIARREVERFQKEIEMEIGTVVTEDGKPKVDPDGKPIRRGGRLEKVLQEREKDRQTRFGKVRGLAAENIRKAEEYSKVELTRADKMVTVAEINLEAAQDKAAAIRETGFAEAEVIVMQNQAEAEGVKARISAFGSGEKYAEYLLSIRLSPAVTRILSNTDGPFAELFQRFTREEGEK
ncbi:MAG: SPFH domain-containing protein [Planctomycetota bacterium]|jgi:regulator of protease activity HflC (stomatin/prohibitin superfamily)